MVAQHDSQSEPALADLGETPAVRVVELSYRDGKVLDAVQVLIDGTPSRVSWRGTQRDISTVSRYSVNVVRDALYNLEEAGLLWIERMGRGVELTYMLRAVAPDGVPFRISIHGERRARGRDVVRAATGLSASSEHLTTDRSEHHHTTTAGTSPPPHQVAQEHALSTAPSLSSRSSSSPPRAGVEVGGVPGEVPGPPSPAQAGTEARLRALGIDPEPDIVVRLAALTGDAADDTWRRVELRRTSSPDFVRLCLDSTDRMFRGGATRGRRAATSEQPPVTLGGLLRRAAATVAVMVLDAIEVGRRRR